MVPAVLVEPGAPTRAGRRRVLGALCLSEITSYGVLYYAFPVLASSITAQTGWPVPATTAAFTAALLVSGLVGVPAGRWVDRYGPRAVMTSGSLLGVLSLVLIATAPSLAWFFGAWLLAGVAMAGVFYPPAFAALTRWHGPERVAALTILTLVAGLASTVFAPLTAALSHHLDWRGTYLALAAVLAVVTVPAHAVGLALPWPAPPPAPATTVTDASAGQDPKIIARSRTFLTLAGAFSLATLALTAVGISLVPLLLSRGMSVSSAALVLGLGGLGQVAGRFGYAPLAARTSVRTRTVLVLLVGALSGVLFGLVPGPAAVLAAVSFTAGAVRGISTLLQATAVFDRWGSDHYGRLNGLLNLPITFSKALAPATGAALAGILGGYPAAFLALGSMTVLAAALAAHTIGSSHRA